MRSFCVDPQRKFSYAHFDINERDMIVLDDERPLIPIQSLIHTSDPGQFGVDKSLLSRVGFNYLDYGEDPSVFFGNFNTKAEYPTLSLWGAGKYSFFSHNDNPMG